MKALTLTQPWATLVAIEAKRIETRSWSTNYRGPLAIHAAKGFPEEAQFICFQDPVFRFILSEHDLIELGKPYLGKHKFPLGCVIATCELVGVDQFGHWVNDRKPMVWGKGKYIFELTDQERAFGDYSIGRFGWFLANVKRLETPIPVRGSLGLWDWNEQVSPIREA